MSIVIVVFPGGPQISQEAQQKEKVLDDILEEKIKGLYLFTLSLC